MLGVKKLTLPYIYFIRVYDGAFLRYLLRIKTYTCIIPWRLAILSLRIDESTHVQEWEMAARRLIHCYSVHLRWKSFPDSRTATAYSYSIKLSTLESTKPCFKNFSGTPVNLAHYMLLHSKGPALNGLDAHDAWPPISSYILGWSGTLSASRCTDYVYLPRRHSFFMKSHLMSWRIRTSQ